MCRCSTPPSARCRWTEASGSSAWRWPAPCSGTTNCANWCCGPGRPAASRSTLPLERGGQAGYSVGPRSALDEVIAVLPGVLDRDVPMLALIGPVGRGPVRQHVIVHMLVEPLAQLGQVHAVVLHQLDGLRDVAFPDQLLDLALHRGRGTREVQRLGQHG